MNKRIVYFFCNLCLHEGNCFCHDWKLKFEHVCNIQVNSLEINEKNWANATDVINFTKNEILLFWGLSGTICKMIGVAYVYRSSRLKFHLFRTTSSGHLKTAKGISTCNLAPFCQFWDEIWTEKRQQFPSRLFWAWCALISGVHFRWLLLCQSTTSVSAQLI